MIPQYNSGYVLKITEIGVLKRELYICVHSSIFHNIQETIQMSIGGERVNKTWHFIHTVGYQAALKRKKILTQATTLYIQP